MKLLNIDRNAKTVKGQKRGVLTGILYLAPAKLSGFEVCPQRSPGCTAACLNTAGRGACTKTQESRIRKTQWYFNDRPAFMAQLVKEIAALVRKAERDGFIPAVRLNGTSDIPWERVKVTRDCLSDGRIFRTSELVPILASLAEGPSDDNWWIKGHDAPNLMAVFPNVKFYDYTKVTKRALAAASGGDDWPANYKLTFSLTEDNDDHAVDVLDAGGNVSSVFRDDLPYVLALEADGLGSVRLYPEFDPRFCEGGYEVIDGDEDDLRFLDKSGVIVGLKAKGKAKHDKSGFVRG